MDISVTTFNCGKQFPLQDETRSLSIIEQLIPVSETPLDLYVLGFQELVEIWEGCFDESINQVLDGISEHTLGKLRSMFPGVQWELITSSHLGAIATIVIGKQQTKFGKIKDVSHGTCHRGMFYSNLKGGAATCITFEDSGSLRQQLLLINCHLAANEGEWNRELRIQDQNAIISQFKQQFNMESQSNILLFGDLNFRNMKVYNVLQTDYNDTTTRQRLLENIDELNILRGKKTIFEGFEESQIGFPPTFKYTVEPLDEVNRYNEKRVPSWCDRILYTKGNPKTYTSVSRAKPLQFSDHQPVNLTITVPSSTSPQLVSVSNTTVPFMESLGSLVDKVIGYAGWMISLNVHRWILGLYILWVLYRYFL